MSVTDEQLEQLEAYMDGELHAEQEDVVRRQLESDSALVAALDMLRSERDVRGTVWRSYEPSDAAVQRLVMKVEQAVDRDMVWAHRLAKWRIPSAAAACILIGFMVGWVGRGTPSSPGAPVGSGGIASSGEPNAILPIQPRVAPGGGLATVGARTGPVDLAIVDENGKQLGVQRFNSVEDAARFVEDLQRWQRAQEKLKSGNVASPGEEKF